MSRSLIVDLTGTCNGINRNFTVPSAYVTETGKLIVNGVVYAADDGYWGFEEIDPDAGTIRTTTAPPSGTEMQFFYEEQELTGTPFHPDGEYP